jgi:hypothetical protein
MATIDAVVTALATRLRTITLSDERFSVYEELVGDAYPPAILIDTPTDLQPINLPETEFAETYPLYLVVNATDMRQMQRDLRAYLSKSGAQSIRAALMADPTLGGVVQTLWVRSPTQVGPLDVAEEDLFGAVIPVEVYN